MHVSPCISHPSLDQLKLSRCVNIPYKAPTTFSAVSQHKSLGFLDEYNMHTSYNVVY